MLPPYIDRMRILVPGAVTDVCRMLKSAGKQCYLVGGAVRDALRVSDQADQAKQSDWDLATDATPTETMALFDRVIPTGLAHGTVTVRHGGMSLETTTFRTESTYSDARRPDDVIFVSTIEQDLSRRDFTINAIAYDPLVDLIVDPFGGYADLRQQLIRCVGDPAERFTEDALRILRAIRFCSQLGFSIDPLTHAAAHKHVANVVHVARERISDEFRKMLQGDALGEAVRLPVFGALLPHVFPSAVLADTIDIDLLCQIYDSALQKLDDQVANVRHAMRHAMTGAATSETVSSVLATLAITRICLLLALLRRHGIDLDLSTIARDLRLPKRVSTDISRVMNGLSVLGEAAGSVDLYRLRRSMSLATRIMALTPSVLCAALTESGQVVCAGESIVSTSLNQIADPDLCLSVSELGIDGRYVAKRVGVSGKAIGDVLEAFLDDKLRDPRMTVDDFFASLRA